MASKAVFSKPALRLTSAVLLLALVSTSWAHVTETAQYGLTSQAFGFDGDADADGATMIWTSQHGAPGNIIEVSWEHMGLSFRPVFDRFDFYVVPAGQADGIEAGTADLLFQARDDDGNCCEGGVATVETPPGVRDLSFVWQFQYAPGWKPVEQDSGDALLEPGNGDQQERELEYINAFVDGAVFTNMFGEGFRTSSPDRLAENIPYMVAEAILGTAFLGVLAASLVRRQSSQDEGDVGRFVGLVTRGRDHLLSLLNVYVLLGPLLFLIGFLGQEAINYGGLTFYDPTGIYTGWIESVVFALWLLGVAMWAFGLFRVGKSLYHYMRTQEPDLGGVGA